MLERNNFIAEAEKVLTSKDLVSQKLGSQIAKAGRAAVAALAMGVVTTDAKETEAQTLPGVLDGSVNCEISSSEIPTRVRVSGALNDGRRDPILFVGDHIERTTGGVTYEPYPNYRTLTPDDVNPDMQFPSSGRMSIVLPDGRFFNNSGGPIVNISNELQVGVDDGDRVNASPNGRNMQTVGMSQYHNQDPYFLSFGRQGDTSMRYDQLYAISLDVEDGDRISTTHIYDASADRLPTGATGVTLTATNTDEQTSLVLLTFQAGLGKVFVLDRDQQVLATTDTNVLTQTVFHPSNPHRSNMRGGAFTPVYESSYNLSIGGVPHEHRIINCTYTSLNAEDPTPTCTVGQILVDGNCYTICEDGQILEDDECRDETCEDLDNCEEPVDPVGPIDPVSPTDPEDPVDPERPCPAGKVLIEGDICADPIDPENPVDPIDPVNPNPNPVDPEEPVNCENGQILDPIDMVCVTECSDGTLTEDPNACPTVDPDQDAGFDSGGIDTNIPHSGELDADRFNDTDTQSPRERSDASQGCAATPGGSPDVPTGALVALGLVLASTRKRFKDILGIK